jgi:hypothetical protein
MAQRILKAVRKHKAKFPNAAQARIVVHPVHDIEKGIDGLNAERNEALPNHMTPGERMERLVQALGRFVDDEPEQLGRGSETVWDVGERKITTDSRSYMRYLENSLTLIRHLLT